MNDNAYLLIAIAFIVGALIFYLIAVLVFSGKKSKLQADISTLKNQLTESKAEAEKEKLRMENNFTTRLTEKEKLLEIQAVELKNWEEKWKKAQTDFQEKTETLRKEFEILAQKILDEKSQKFTEVNQKNMEQILLPFQETLKTFKQKVEESEKESYGRHKELQQQLKNLQELNRRLSEEANNLTKALKGESKTQGIWGETILNRVLELSGLEEGREYVVQQSFEATDTPGRKRVQPDVVIYLPGNKAMVIDAKVSLTAYERYVNAETEEDKKQYLQQHLNSVKIHINSLSKKSYDRILEGRTPEFILMFIPVEPAFSLAMQADPGLYDYAFERHIVLVTPFNLLATLKIVENLWRYEKQNQNALQIAREAGLLYDKFAGFVTDLQNLENRLEKAQESLTEAKKKLFKGGGNLLGKVEKLKKLGAKAKKQIPENPDSQEYDMLEE